ncbi:spore germination protein [Paenibacillus radicis (ex Xue et al. 2023)]|uniref:Spore germination protein n=1 Tax=Paenibacillus radicis (ex Xue et al. 2023) TaxID=2972489 RepID=A0ABT1YRT0_9BACL|nr:spore germination protein [Paenibacillus radicis (ex Xue et al. 2023)]MCR8635884.1 spore germination protein [Paenibacillus radicis (ex Xue et al. 2023)]
MYDSIKLDWEQQLIDQMKDNADFTITTVSFSGQLMTLYYLKSLVDLSETLSIMEQNPEESLQAAPFSIELVTSMLSGEIIIRQMDSDKPISLTPVGSKLSRPIMPPQNEHPLQVAFDSFTEDLNTNIGLLRKKVKRKDMVVESHTTGTNSPRDIAFIYVKGEANIKVVEFIKQKLQNNKSNDIKNVADLLKMLEQPQLSLVPTYLSTEIAEETAQNLLDGKVIIIMDQFPFALAFPAIIKDLWSLKSDLNYPALVTFFYRFFRIVGILFAIVTPGLYVILNSVNPELLRIQLAISVAQSREGVPYPAIVEVCLMLVLLEMVIEATTRLPKSIGPTITMIGGIILGQAIVQAQLVSNLLIIILATSTIANFAIAGYMNTVGIRIFKYFTLLLSTMFGIFGLEASIIGLCIYLSGLNTTSVPYMSLSVKGQTSYE